MKFRDHVARTRQAVRGGLENEAIRIAPARQRILAEPAREPVLSGTARADVLTIRLGKAGPYQAAPSECCMPKVGDAIISRAAIA